MLVLGCLLNKALAALITMGLSLPWMMMLLWYRDVLGLVGGVLVSVDGVLLSVDGVLVSVTTSHHHKPNQHKNTQKLVHKTQLYKKRARHQQPTLCLLNKALAALITMGLSLLWMMMLLWYRDVLVSVGGVEDTTNGEYITDTDDDPKDDIDTQAIVAQLQQAITINRTNTKIHKNWFTRHSLTKKGLDINNPPPVQNRKQTTQSTNSNTPFRL
jgi:hypothetical protein